MHHLGALLVVLLLLIVDTVSSRRHAYAPHPQAAAGGPYSGGGGGVQPQAPTQHLPPCVEELLPCTAYLKTTKHPSATCCTSMHNAAAEDEMPCLCRLFADPELLATFNVTREQMFKLPARCGLPVGCRAGNSSHHDPVVEGPPPPAPAHHHQHAASSRGDEFRSIWSLIASLVLGHMVPMAALF